MAAVLHVLLYLPLLPSRGRIAELGIEQVMAHHGAEAQVHVAQLAAPNPIHRGLHVVVDATSRDAAPGRKGVMMGIEQHLVGLQEICAQEECPAVAELELRDLQLGALAVNDRPVLAPVELKRFALSEKQRDERTFAGCLRLLQLLLAPATCEGGHAVVGSGEAECTQIGVDLLEGASLLARLVGFRLEPTRQLGGIAVELAGTLPRGIGRHRDIGAQVTPDGVAGDTKAPGDLAKRDLVTQVPASNDAQNGHVDHSELPPVAEQDSVLHVGQHSMQITGSSGSVLDATQQSRRSLVDRSAAVKSTVPIARAMASATWSASSSIVD